MHYKFVSVYEVYWYKLISPDQHNELLDLLTGVNISYIWQSFLYLTEPFSCDVNHKQKIHPCTANTFGNPNSCTVPNVGIITNAVPKNIVGSAACSKQPFPIPQPPTGGVYSFNGKTLYVDGGCRAVFYVCYLDAGKLHRKWASSRENLSSGFVTRVDSNRPPQLQRLAAVLKFWI